MTWDKEAIYLELLVLRCKRGDRQALTEMIRHWEKPLFYYIRRLVDEEETAWDVLQETWLKVLGGIGQLRQPRSLPTWLYRLARNTAMSHLRGRIKDRAFNEASEIACDSEGNVELSGFEDAQSIHYGLSKLSLPHREVLTLHFLEDLSVDDIAAILGVPPGTVKSRLHYAKAALRKVLEKEG